METKDNTLIEWLWEEKPPGKVPMNRLEIFRESFHKFHEV
jgi:hypothetical protein